MGKIIQARVITRVTPFSSFLLSSIWAGIKYNIEGVHNHITSQLEDGKNINFWVDTRLSRPIVETLNIS